MNEKKFNYVLSGSFYNLIATYSAFFFGILTTAILSRLLTPEEFGYFLSSFAIILIFQVIHWFIPPGMNSGVLYYLPNMIINEKNMIRNFLFSVLIIRIVSLSFISFIYYFLIGLLYKGNFLLLYILRRFTILLILNEIIRTLFSISIGFQKYQLYSILMIIKDFLIFFSLSYAFFYWKRNYLDFVLNVYIFIHLFIFILLLGISFNLFKKYKEKNTDFNFIFKFKKYSKYGLPLALISLFDLIQNDFNNAILSKFKNPFDLVLYSIAQRGANIVHIGTGSSSQLISAFVKTDAKISEDEINNIFIRMVDFLGFFAIFIMITLFNFGDIYIEIIYTPIYLEAFILLRIMLFTGFIKFFIDYYSLLFKFKGITNKLLKIKSMISLLWLIISIIIIILFPILWIVIFTAIFQTFNWIIFFLFTRKNIQIKVGFKNISKIILIYSVSISSILLFSLIFSTIYSNQLFIINIAFKILIYLTSIIIVLILNWKLKLINRESLNEIIESNLFPKFINKFLKRALFIFPSNNDYLQK